MKRYKLMPAAEQDLSDLVDFVARDSPQNALKIFDKIHAAARSLSEMPNMGHAREDITDKAVKFWAVYSWLIVYRPDRRPIEILRIVHGAQKLEQVLRLDE